MRPERGVPHGSTHMGNFGLFGLDRGLHPCATMFVDQVYG